MGPPTWGWSCRRSLPDSHPSTRVVAAAAVGRAQVLAVTAGVDVLSPAVVRGRMRIRLLHLSQGFACFEVLKGPLYEFYGLLHHPVRSITFSTLLIIFFIQSFQLGSLSMSVPPPVPMGECHLVGFLYPLLFSSKP